MNENEHPPTGVASGDARHENRDVSLRGILWFALAILVTAVVIHGTMLVLFRSYETREDNQQPIIPMAGDRPTLPPEPRLEGLESLSGRPPTEKQEWKKVDPTILDTYGWVNQEEKIVRVPVKKAMELLEKKLNGNAHPEKAMPVKVAPSRASSGRVP